MEKKKIGRKVGYKGELLKSTKKKLFMDRDHARQCFWDTYDALEEEAAFVINYYGFGGIGKSELCNHLKEILDSNIHPNTKEELNSKSFVFSFEEIKNNCDIVEVLSCLANKFEKECGYDLIYFKYALYAYYRKKGLSVESPEINNLGKNSAFNMVLDAVAFVPVVGEIGSAIIKNADVLVSDVKALMLEHKEEILDLDILTENGIKERLVSFFVKDIYRFLAKEKRPVVVFLDTYEHLQNYIHKNPAKISEEFLWADTGMIRNMPNVLWVIAGQQKLTWAEDSYRKYNDDDYWMAPDTITYELLEEIKEDYIINWFKKLDIEDKELVHFIYQKTKGVPIHVSGCIDRYFAIKNKEKQPAKADFDMDYKELAARFIGGLSDEARDMIEILACLETWTYEDIRRLGKSYSLYEYLKQFSFITVSGDIHNMNEAVREMVCRDSHTLNKEECIKYLREKAADETLAASERKECTFRKIKLQLFIIGAEKEKEQKYKLAEAFLEENIDYIRESIYDDNYFKSVLKLMREYIPENCVPDTYQYALIAYQAYRWSYEGNYKSAEGYIELIDMANFDSDLYKYAKGKYYADAERLLCCAKAMCYGTEQAYLEAINCASGLNDNYTEILMLAGYASVLEHNGRYNEAVEYCERAMEVLAGMQADTLRAGFECEIILVQAKAKFELFCEEEALLLLTGMEKTIEKYKNAQDENALVWFAQIYSLIADLSYEESKRLEYAQKSLDISKKVFALNPNDTNKNNAADSYKTVAELLPPEDESVITYYDTAITMLEELYREEKEVRYLKEWILTMNAAFEKTRDDSYFNNCKSIIECEYKPLIISYIESKKLDSAKQLLEDYNAIIYELYIYDRSDYMTNGGYKEFAWLHSKMASIEYFLGNRKAAILRWRDENADRKMLARSCETEDIRAYVESAARCVLLWTSYDEREPEIIILRSVLRTLREGVDLFCELAETMKESTYVEEFYETAAKYLELLIEMYPVFEKSGDIEKAQILREQMEKLRNLLSDLKQNYFFN